MLPFASQRDDLIGDLRRRPIPVEPNDPGHPPQPLLLIPSEPSRRLRDGSLGISRSGCGGCPGSLGSTGIGLRRRSPMRSSRWDANGNIYLVTEESLTPGAVRAEVGDADGILEVFRCGDDWVEIAIWNPDGSRAEMSGNGTRIAACWLTERTGAEEVVVRVGPREVRARMLGGTLVEQDMGEVVVSEREEVAGVEFTAVDVGNPHAVVDGDPADLPRIGPMLEG